MSQSERDLIAEAQRWSEHSLYRKLSDALESRLDAEVGEGAAEYWAKRFHETYERLAPDFGYETRKESAKPWEDVPEQNKRLMIAVAGEVLGQLLREREEQLEERVKELESGLHFLAPEPKVDDIEMPFSGSMEAKP